MKKTTLFEIPGGPPAIGPYAPAVIAEGRVLYISGQIPYCPEAGGIVRGTIEEQTEIVLKNLELVVKTAGGTLDQVVSCRVYLQSLTPETFQAMNSVYARYFEAIKPARATLGAQLLNFDVEIEAIAVLD